MKSIPSALVAVLFSSSAAFAITIDGVKDAGYGAALSVQTVETGFGDNFSEWNAGYGRIESGRLFLMLTGNLEANFNKLEIFIDSKAGGQNVFTSSGNDNANRMNGLVFDAGFTADYHLILRRGNNGGNDTFDVDFANLGAASFSSYSDILGGLTGSATTGTGVNANGIGVAYDNSNVAGIGGGAPNAANQAAALAVLTGLELSIDLADLGATGDIRVMVGQNGGGHDYWSNQFLGGLAAPQGNLGGDEAGGFTGEGAIDMTHFAGDQFFTVVVPEPSSLAMFAVGSLVVMAGMRRRGEEARN
ncbi:MAG: PEP-CTERM sorting domain-containing protein [Verrucomicrobia bacterium]|nr:PEP-CTERM sorting domain-containing protein [Verrucomicrobiota bacterium]